MNPLVTTVGALKELATGLAPAAVATSSSELIERRGEYVDVLVARGDVLDVQRVILMRPGDGDEKYVPEHLSGVRREVASRMAAFAERARSSGGSLTLPSNWSQYKFNSLIAFFVIHGIEPSASRWIAEVLPGSRNDVVFWTVTTSRNKVSLEEFDQVRPVLPEFEHDFRAAIQLANQRDSTPSSNGAVADVEISLQPLDPTVTKGWTYEEWLGAISEDQRSFVLAPTDKSIRLRGPAGSGKTLALTLKVSREVFDARDRGADLRVLVATHSWSLANQISNALDSMLDSGTDEVYVCPLLEIARSISPQYVIDTSGFSLAGDDSFSGKQAQLDQILDVLADFIEGDWITYRARVSQTLKQRLDSPDADDRFALAWDLLIEFGSVLGASAIFPGAGAESRYFQLSRAAWMLPLETRDDLRVVFDIYTRYMASLEQRSLLTYDQVLADLLSHLETHSWNRARRMEGYDLIFVDEFHLFSPLERQVLHYLSRDVAKYPRVFMAVDPRQSPSEAFIGAASDETRSSSSAPDGGELGDVAQFELTTIHRFTPEILALVKHVHHEFPTLDLGNDWDVDYAQVESSKDSGPVPHLLLAASDAAEETDIAKAVAELYPRGRMALAIVDQRQWRRYSELAARLDTSRRFHVSTISSRTELDEAGRRTRGLLVAPAEYLAGLQFDSVLVAGIPDMRGTYLSNHDRTRLLSLLYLGISRAEREVRLFVNDDEGGVADVLGRAVLNGYLRQERGSLV